MTEGLPGDPTGDDRHDPPLQGDEAATLLGFLDFHRDTLRWKTSSLGAADLRRRVAPSGMTLGGLLHHLAFVEDHWCTVVWSGKPASEPWASADWGPRLGLDGGGRARAGRAAVPVRRRGGAVGPDPGGRAGRG